MKPQEVFCPNINCPARGKIGKGNNGIQSRKEKRFVCQFAIAHLQREKAPCSIAYTAIPNWFCW
jgi:hypothetical protein